MKIPQSYTVLYTEEHSDPIKIWRQCFLFLTLIIMIPMIRFLALLCNT